MKSLITHKQLKKLLYYNPETGDFIRKTSLTPTVVVGDIAGSINDKGYIVIYVNGKTYRANRLAFFYMKGYWPKYEIDHKDRIKSNNKWNNLRQITKHGNNINKTPYKNNNTGVTGVCYNKARDRWAVWICKNKKNKCIGYFKIFRQAVKARLKVEKEYNFHKYNKISSAYLYLKENKCNIQ